MSLYKACFIDAKKNKGYKVSNLLPPKKIQSYNTYNINKCLYKKIKMLYNSTLIFFNTLLCVKNPFLVFF